MVFSGVPIIFKNEVFEEDETCVDKIILNNLLLLFSRRGHRMKVIGMRRDQSHLLSADILDVETLQLMESDWSLCIASLIKLYHTSVPPLGPDDDFEQLGR